MADNKVTAARKAREALKTAEEAARQEVNTINAQSESDRVEADMKAKADAEANTVKSNQTVEGDAGDSKRVEVIITRKYSDQKHKIFASTVITKNGKRVLEQFRVPVNVPVSIPVEIVKMIKERTVAKYVDNTQVMATEFLVEKTDSDI